MGRCHVTNIVKRCILRGDVACCHLYCNNLTAYIYTLIPEENQVVRMSAKPDKFLHLKDKKYIFTHKCAYVWTVTT